MGFTLAFGAMFSKVWRVHRFTTKAKTDPKVSYRAISFNHHLIHVTHLEKSGAMEALYDGIGSPGC